MAAPNQKQNWRSRLGWLAGQLFVIFLGVTAAFIVENYSEFVGIHDNYDRYNQFTEREILPRLAAGPDPFYGPDGKLLPMFRVHMDLQSEFAAELRKLSQMAHDLRLRLEAVRNPK